MPNPPESPSPKGKKKRNRKVFAETWDYPEDAHPVWEYLDGLGGNASRRTMGSALDSVADILSNGKVTADEIAWHRLRGSQVLALRGRMLELYAPSTTNRYLAAVRGVLKACWRLGLVDNETMQRTIDVMTPARGKRVLRGRSVQPQEIVALFEACQKDPNENIGLRDAALLALLYGTGMRRAEAASVTLEAFDQAAGRIRIIGKGNKERDVYLPEGTKEAVQAWIRVRGASPGPLFTRVNKSGEVKTDGITDQLIYYVVEKRHLEAGVQPFTPHDLRRSLISELLDRNVDIALVARQVGHSNVQTTARYDRRDDSAQKRAVLKMDVPYPG